MANNSTADQCDRQRVTHMAHTKQNLVFHAGVVQAGVEHDDGEGQHVARVLAAEDPDIALAVADGKLVLHF